MASFSIKTDKITNFKPYFLSIKWSQRKILGFFLFTGIAATILHINLNFYENIFFLPLEYCAMASANNSEISASSYQKANINNDWFLLYFLRTFYFLTFSSSFKLCVKTIFRSTSSRIAKSTR